MAEAGSIDIGLNFVIPPASVSKAERDIQTQFSRINRDISFRVNDRSFTEPLGRISRSASEFQRSLDASNARVIAFGASAGIIYNVGRAMAELVKSTIGVEKQLTDINVVLNLSSSNLAKFGQDLFKIANNTGQSFNNVAKAAIELSRQGLSVSETLKRTNDALTLTRFSGLEAEQTVKALTATLNSFNDVTLDSTKLLNKLVAVDLSFAVSTGDLVTAFQRVGSTAKDAGVGIDSLIGLVTAAQQTTGRGGAVIGNALKTIFQRIQRPEVLSNFKELGIAVEDGNGKILAADAILKQLAGTYATLNPIQKSYVDQLASGVFQANQFKAILSDLSRENSIYAGATLKASSATNEAILRQQELNKTTAALYQQTVNNLTNLGSKIGSQSVEPLIRKFLGGVNDIGGTISDAAGTTIGQGILKGIGNFLEGPGLAIGLGLLTKLLLNFGSYTIKAFGQILETQGSQYKILQATNNLIAQQPDLQAQVLKGLLTEEQLRARILSLVEATNTQSNAGAIIAASVKGLQSEGKIAIANERIVPGKRAAVGYIPQIQETLGAIRGGYTPGTVRETSIPGVGSVVYNTAETVKQFPGLTQPAIIPPQQSKAGINYNKSFIAQHGFSPYQSQGFVPNFMPDISRGQLEILLKDAQFAKRLKSFTYTNAAGETKDYNIAQHRVRRDKLVGAPAPGGYPNWTAYDEGTNTLALYVKRAGMEEPDFKRFSLDRFKQLRTEGDVFDIIRARGHIPNFAETIKMAAIKYGDYIFKGNYHGEALTKMGRTLGLGDDIPFPSNYLEGFITNQGRFVSREDAAKIANLNRKVAYSEDFGYKGLIPNFAKNHHHPLAAAIAREQAAGVPPSLIKVSQSPLLQSPANPAGLGVHNLRDEPAGLIQGIRRYASLGLDPRRAGVPNFVKDPIIESEGSTIGTKQLISTVLPAFNELKDSFIQGKISIDEFKSKVKDLTDRFNATSKSVSSFNGIVNYLETQRKGTAVNQLDIASQKYPPLPPRISVPDFQQFARYEPFISQYATDIRYTPNPNFPLTKSQGPFQGQLFGGLGGQQQEFQGILQQIQQPRISAAAFPFFGPPADQFRYLQAVDRIKQSERINQILRSPPSSYLFNPEGFNPELTIGKLTGGKDNGLSRDNLNNLNSGINQYAKKIVEGLKGGAEEAEKLRNSLLQNARTFTDSEETIKKYEKILVDTEVAASQYRNFYIQQQKAEELANREKINKINNLQSTAGQYFGIGSFFGKGKTALADLEKESPQAAQEFKTSFQNRAFLASFVAPLIGGVLQQAVGYESKGARGTGQALAGIGNTVGYAATFGALSNFNPYAIAIGAGLGALTEGVKVIDSFTNRLPDLEKEFDKMREQAGKAADSLQSFISISEQINDIQSGKIRASDSETSLLLSKRSEAFLGIPDTQRRKFTNALLGGKGEAEAAGSLVNDIKNQLGIKELEIFLEKRKNEAPVGGYTIEDFNPQLGIIKQFSNIFGATKQGLLSPDTFFKNVYEGENIKNQDNREIAKLFESQIFSLRNAETGKGLFTKENIPILKDIQGANSIDDLYKKLGVAGRKTGISEGINSLTTLLNNKDLVPVDTQKEFFLGFKKLIDDFIKGGGQLLPQQKEFNYGFQEFRKNLLQTSIALQNFEKNAKSASERTLILANSQAQRTGILSSAYIDRSSLFAGPETISQLRSQANIQNLVSQASIEKLSVSTGIKDSIAKLLNDTLQPLLSAAEEDIKKGSIKGIPEKTRDINNFIKELDNSLGEIDITKEDDIIKFLNNISNEIDKINTSQTSVPSEVQRQRREDLRKIYFETSGFLTTGRNQIRNTDTKLNEDIINERIRQQYEQQLIRTNKIINLGGGVDNLINNKSGLYGDLFSSTRGLGSSNEDIRAQSALTLGKFTQSLGGEFPTELAEIIKENLTKTLTSLGEASPVKPADAAAYAKTIVDNLTKRDDNQKQFNEGLLKFNTNQESFGSIIGKLTGEDGIVGLKSLFTQGNAKFILANPGDIASAIKLGLNIPQLPSNDAKGYDFGVSLKQKLVSNGEPINLEDYQKLRYPEFTNESNDYIYNLLLGKTDIKYKSNSGFADNIGKKDLADESYRLLLGLPKTNYRTFGTQPVSTKNNELDIQKQLNLAVVAQKTKEDDLLKSLKDQLAIMEGLKEIGIGFTEEMADANLKIAQQQAKLGQGSDINFGKLFLDNFKYGSNELHRDLANLASNFGKDFKGAFQEGFKEFALGTKNAKDALKDFGINIATKLLGSVSEIGINSLFGGLASLFGSSGTTSGVGSIIGNLLKTQSQGGAISRFARGGTVYGGSGVRDDVPAMLNEGEYVIKKSSATKYGSDFLNAVNEGLIPKFAGGGLKLQPSKRILGANKDPYNISGLEYLTAVNFGPTDNPALQNTFDYYGVNKGKGKTHPVAGAFNVSSQLSNFARTDENSVQNQIKFGRESSFLSYVQGYREYLKQKRFAMSQFENAQNQRLIGAAISAVGIVGGAAIGSAFNSAGNTATSNISNDEATQALSQYYQGNIDLTPEQVSAYTQQYQTVSSQYLPIATRDYRLAQAFGYGNIGYTQNVSSLFSNTYANATRRGYAIGGRSTDNIPALLTGGEYVVRKEAANFYGSDMLNKINMGTFNAPARGYASGGLVGRDVYGDFLTTGVSDSENRIAEVLSKLNTLFDSIKKYFDDKNKSTPANKTSENKNSGGITNNVSIQVTIDKSGQSKSTSTTDSNSTDQQDKTNAQKTSELLKSEIIKVLNQQLRPNGLLKESFKRG